MQEGIESRLMMGKWKGLFVLENLMNVSKHNGESPGGQVHHSNILNVKLAINTLFQRAGLLILCSCSSRLLAIVTHLQKMTSPPKFGENLKVPASEFPISSRLLSFRWSR